MFCPQCRYEYKPGINRCPDCDVELVSSLPPEEEEEVEYSAPVQVFETNDSSILLVAQSLLEAADIQFWTRGTGAADVAMPGGTATAGAGGSRKLMVRVDDREEAKEILSELQEELKDPRDRRLKDDYGDEDDDYDGEPDDDYYEEDDR